LYATAHPHRLSRLILVTPGLAAVDVVDAGNRSALDRRVTEPWYPVARAALERIFGGDLSMEMFRASRPLCYGRWDEGAQAHATVGMAKRHLAARRGYFADVVLEPAATRAALAELSAPVLLYAGDMDPMVTPAMVREAARLCLDATVVVQPGAAHFPWLDDPAAFTGAVRSFLG
jgi:pimeloyl-ACP methyl ester carboxylesterase